MTHRNLATFVFLAALAGCSGSGSRSGQPKAGTMTEAPAASAPVASSAETPPTATAEATPPAPAIPPQATAPSAQVMRQNATPAQQFQQPVPLTPAPSARQSGPPGMPPGMPAPPRAREESAPPGMPPPVPRVSSPSQSESAFAQRPNVPVAQPAVAREERPTIVAQEIPTPPAAVPPPATPAVATYRGPSSGVINYSARVEKDQVFTIEGQFPGVPVMVNVDTKEFGIVEAPSPRNGWNKLTLRSRNKRNVVVPIQWTVVGQ